MIRILITDDEVFTVKSIKVMLMQKFLDAEIETCNNGFEAISAVREKNFDIALMDINMPGIEGLSAIKQMKKINPNLRFIIISAHSEFKYAQHAITLGVDTYLLKPIVREKLFSTISDLIEEITLEKLKKEKQSEIKLENLKLKKYARKELLEKIILGKKVNEDFGELKDILGMGSDAVYIIVIYLESISVNERELIDELCNTAEHIMESIAIPMMENSMIALVGNGTFLKEEDDSKVIRMKCNYLLECFKKKREFRVKIGIGRMYSNLDKLNQSYLEAKKAINDNTTWESISFYRESIAKNVTEELPNIQEEVKKIISMDYLEVENEVNCFISIVFQNAIQIKKQKAYLMEFINQLRSEVTRLYLHFFKNYSEIDTYYQNILFSQSEVELGYLIVKYVQMVVLHLKEISSDTAGLVIRLVIDYIDENYRQDVTLKNVAEHVHISYYYLSRIFKKRTGYSFNTYLINKRIQVAQKLLCNSTTPIKDVAMLVGYANNAYFGKVFKEKVGYTPSEYREGLIRGIRIGQKT